MEADLRRRVALPGQLDMTLSLDGLQHHGDDGIDRWDGKLLLRTVPSDGRHVPFAAAAAGGTLDPALDVWCDTHVVPVVDEAVRSMFLSPGSNWNALLARDPVLRALDTRYAGSRPLRYFDLYGMLVRSISAQQVNLRWAATTRRRLAERHGTLHHLHGHKVFSLEPHRLADATVADLRALQFTTRKAEYIIGTARAVVDGEIDGVMLQTLPDGEVVRALTAIRGIGLWTAEWVLVRYLGRPRVVGGDLGVRKAVGRAYLGDPAPAEAAVRAATVHWGESAALAQHLLLHALAVGDL